MRRLPTFFFSASLLMLGCNPASRVAVDAGVELSGAIQSQDGSALANAKVVLVKQPDLFEVAAGLFTFPLTVASCFTDTPAPLCAQARTTTTDANGHYAYALSGGDTHASGNTAATFDLTSGKAKTGNQLRGASATDQFLIQDTKLAMPLLQLWEPTLSSSVDAGIAAVSFEAPDAAKYGADVTTAVSFQTDSGALVWAQPTAAGTALDVRLLEDKTSGVHAAAHSTVAGPGAVFTFTYNSPETPFSGTAGAPPSRSARCFTQVSGAAQEISPCTLTDGDFQKAIALAPAICSAVDGGVTADGGAADAGTPCVLQNQWAYVDLGESKAASLVVVRGFASDEVVELSLDGTTWLATTGNAVKVNGTNTGLWSAVLPPASVTRYVRVRSTSQGGFVSGLTEISVW